jgi:hypothetical protein
MSNKIEPISIGTIGNYCGGLFVAEHGGKYYWIIENGDGPTDFDNIKEYEEIDQQLFESLLRWEHARLKKSQK